MSFSTFRSLKPAPASDFSNTITYSSIWTEFNLLNKRLNSNCCYLLLPPLLPPLLLLLLLLLPPFVGFFFYNRGAALTSSESTQMDLTDHALTLFAVIAADEKTAWSAAALPASVFVIATRPFMKKTSANVWS